MKFRECGELLLGRRCSLKTKGMVYCSCVRSAMLYGSETWCLRENEMIILRRTERAMVRSMCGVQGSHGHGKSWKNKFSCKVMENLQKVESHGKKFGLKVVRKFCQKIF